MTYEELTGPLPHLVARIPALEGCQAERTACNEQQIRDFGLIVGHLVWLPETNQVLLRLAVNSSFHLSAAMEQSLPSQDDVEFLLRPTNNIAHIDQDNQTTIPRNQSGIYFDEVNSQFFVDGQPIPHDDLTEIEYNFLKYLHQNIGRPCSYRDLAKHVWCGWADDNTITQRVYTLRRKLKKISPKAKKGYIKTIRGCRRGYMLTKPSNV
ncbi:MAG: winged helix-turn-helix domain-containing protein [Ardenticatenaceae bacterium]